MVGGEAGSSVKDKLTKIIWNLPICPEQNEWKELDILRKNYTHIYALEQFPSASKLIDSKKIKRSGRMKKTDSKKFKNPSQCGSVG